MSLPSNIIAVVVNYEYINVFDVAVFFYQWKVRTQDKSKLIVILHREQEQFNVTIMNFKNSSTYVQKQIDTILRNHKTFNKVFIDDIVIYSKSLKKYVKHLHIIFNLLNSFNVFLSSIKFFFDYFSISLLKHKINVFDFTIVVEKIETTATLKFSTTFKNLEIYLNFIE